MFKCLLSFITFVVFFFFEVIFIGYDKGYMISISTMSEFLLLQLDSKLALLWILDFNIDLTAVLWEETAGDFEFSTFQSYVFDK